MQSATPKVLLPSVWPLPVSLAATSGISVDFSSSAYLDVSVQRVYLHMTIWFIIQYWSIAPVGFPIRKSTNRWIFAPPRGLSQLVTSFFGSWCQGIRRMLLLAWPRLKNRRFLRYSLTSDFCSHHSNFQTISRSPWVFFMWVSLVKFLDTNMFFNTFSYPFLFEKTLIFFSYLLLLRYSVFNLHSSILDAWKVNSVKRLSDKSSDLIDQ